MPMLKIQTNQIVPEDERPRILADASRVVSDQLGKPETYVMAALESNPDMIFAGSGEPLAYLELKSIGLPGDATKRFSAALAAFVQERLAVAPERVYVEFADAERHMWGWKGGTF